MLNLNGKNALVTGIANNRSIAWGIAEQLHQAGANLGVTYLPDDKGRFEILKSRSFSPPSATSGDGWIS
jgi:enoyl-[acyl-carrier protein] reductase I